MPSLGAEGVGASAGHQLRPLTETWILVKVEDSALDEKPLGGTIFLFVASASAFVKLEKRSEEEVLEAAAASGFDVDYKPNPVPPWVWDKVRHAILAELRVKVKKNVRSFAVSISPVARMSRNRVKKI